MEITSTSKITQQFNTVSHEKSAHKVNNNNFKSNLLHLEYKRALEASANIKCDEKVRAKIEELLIKKISEERRKVRVMIEVLNDISKGLPYLVFNIQPTILHRL